MKTGRAYSMGLPEQLKRDEILAKAEHQAYGEANAIDQEERVKKLQKELEDAQKEQAFFEFSNKPRPNPNAQTVEHDTKTEEKRLAKEAMIKAHNEYWAKRGTVI
jgi:hypothetical protein